MKPISGDIRHGHLGILVSQYIDKRYNKKMKLSHTFHCHEAEKEKHLLEVFTPKSFNYWTTDMAQLVNSWCSTLRTWVRIPTGHRRLDVVFHTGNSSTAGKDHRDAGLTGPLVHSQQYTSGQWKTLPLRRLWRGWREAQSFRALTALTGLVPGSRMTAHNFRIWPARVWWARLWQALSFSPIPSALPKKSLRFHS